jgi:hypothetical protein
LNEQSLLIFIFNNDIVVTNIDDFALDRIPEGGYDEVLPPG